MTSHPPRDGRRLPAYRVGDRVLLRRGSQYVDAHVNAIYPRNGRWLFVVRTVDGAGSVGESVTVGSSAPDGRTPRLIRPRQRGVPR
jgi:hypothetical protein